MAERFLAKIEFGSCGSGACFTLAVAALLMGCATPVDSTRDEGDEEDQKREAKVLDCSPESLGRLGPVDVAIAIDNSLSTQHPAGFDVDGDGTVGAVRASIFTDRDDSWLGAQIAAARPLIQNTSDRDVRFSIVTYSGYPFLSHRRRNTRAVGDRDAMIRAQMTDDVAELESALDAVMNAGSDGSANFYAGMRRARPGPIFHEGGNLVGGLSARMASAVREAKRNNIVFNTFGLTEQSDAWRGFSLGLIARPTGGTYHVVDDPRELYCHLVDALALAAKAHADPSTALDEDTASAADGDASDKLRFRDHR
ncbi:MAG: VWA domain-containing protein [Deltaproteobacteria bacterium]|nr:VWA domain-containing protein [Deltaproteobacteria bacterium]